MTDIRILTEKLKNTKSLRFYLRFSFHLIVCMIFSSVFLYGVYLWSLLMKIDDDTDPYLWLGKYFTPLYLTNWNFGFQTTFLSMSVLYDALEWLDKHESSFGRRLRYVRDLTFSGLVVPMTLFISSMFWIIYWIDRELVFPAVYDQLVPWWFNHCVHTNITIVLLLETILQARRYPANRKIEMIINGTCGVGYAIVYYSIYFFTHRWLYGVFGIMTWWQVCLFQILIWTATYIFYFIQFPINRIFHKADEELSLYQKESPKSINISDPGSGTNSWSFNRNSQNSNL